MLFRRHIGFKYRVRIFPKIWAHHLFFWSGAVVVAAMAILFAKASAIGHFFFAIVLKDYPIVAFMMTPAGFALIALLTRRYFPGAEGSGIPQAIAAIKASHSAGRTSLLSIRVAVSKILLTTLALCVGASVGREGPTVQIGASVMNALTRLVHLPSPRVCRALIMAGGAAGIAAAFNTPLAGVIFSIEELSHSFEERTNGTAITTVVVAGIVSMAVLGNYTYFGHTDVSLLLEQAWKPVLACGIIGGLLGGGFSRVLIFFSRPIHGRVGHFIADRPIAFATLCGLAMSVVGVLSDNTVFGTGYDEARGLIEGTRQLPKSFGILKLSATVLSYISGLPGGIFSPSLAVGAGLGFNMASFMSDIPVSAVVILGMVGYFTGVVQVPLTATVIVMEMTNDPSLTLSLMATAFIAYAFSRLVCPTSLYRALAQTFLTHTKGHPHYHLKHKIGHVA